MAIPPYGLGSQVRCGVIVSQHSVTRDHLEAVRKHGARAIVGGIEMVIDLQVRRNFCVGVIGAVEVHSREPVIAVVDFGPHVVASGGLGCRVIPVGLESISTVYLVNMVAGALAECHDRVETLRYQRVRLGTEHEIGAVILDTFCVFGAP